MPREWVIDPWSVTLAFATEAVGIGTVLRLVTPVVGVRRRGRGSTSSGRPDDVVRTRWLVNAAGLGADRIDAMLGHRDFAVTPGAVS